MAKTLEELVAEIKDRLDIVEVVSEQVILKKNGNHYWGLCPFHKEKTPSFSVNPKLGIYKCFGFVKIFSTQTFEVSNSRILMLSPMSGDHKKRQSENLSKPRNQQKSS